MNSDGKPGWVTIIGKDKNGKDGQEFKLPSKTILHYRTKGHVNKLWEIFSIGEVC